MSELFKVSSNPHIRSKVATNGLMLAVVTALMPAAGFGIYNFGPRALAVIVVTMASTVLTEYFFGLLTKKLTVTDLSAVVTGLLPAGIHPAVDGSPGRRLCHSGGKNAFWGTGTEFHEPGPGGKMFPADFVSHGNDFFSV